MLQSGLGGQVASVGTLVCVAKQNRCRKICLKWGRKWEAGRAGDGRGIKTYLSVEGRALLSCISENPFGFMQVFPSPSNASFSWPTRHSQWCLKI